jgi:5-deoxy-glucuronate isomerase
LGPRRDPITDKPSAFFVGREERLALQAEQESLMVVGSAPAQKKLPETLIMPEAVRTTSRGKGNWTREVRFVCWNDNTVGNMLLACETCTPSGNWSTMPPHRHQHYIQGEEVPYEEAYFYQFSRPQGFGLCWQFDDEGRLDQAFSLRSDDLVYMDAGYHPAVCGPGSMLYHATFMAGPYRTSTARVHDDYRSLLEEEGLVNPYRNQ